MNLRLSILGCVAVCSALTSNFANAEKYRIASTEFAPIAYSDPETKAATGIATDLIRMALENGGIPKDDLMFEINPWARTLDFAKNCEIDIIYTTYRVPERDAYINYSDEIVLSQIIAFYVKKDSKITFDGNLESMKKYTIGTADSISYGTKFDDAKKAFLKTSMVKTLDANFEKLLAGNVDLVVSNIFAADISLSKNKLMDKVKQISVPVERLLSYIGFTKKDDKDPKNPKNAKCKDLAPLKKKFDEEIAKLKKTDKYKNVLKKYIKSEESVEYILK